MATSLPGPGTILTGLEVRFSEAVTFPATIEVRVEVRGRVRRITRAAFRCGISVPVICDYTPLLFQRGEHRDQEDCAEWRGQLSVDTRTVRGQQTVILDCDW